MAIVDISSLWIPQPWNGVASTPGLSASFTFNASGYKLGWILQAPKTGSIRKVHFMTGTVTTPTDLDVRIETIDAATGDPSGTLWAANTNATVVSASLTSNTWITSPALTADASVTKGDLFAAALVPAGTPNWVLSQYNTGVSASTRLPYSTAYNGSWSKQTALSVVAVEYSDGSFAEIPNVFPISAINAHTYSSSSTPDEYSLRFTLPFTARLAGVWGFIDPDNDFDLVIYDGTTPVSTKSFDKDIRQGTGPGMHYLRLTSPVTLTASTVYRASIKPTTTSSLTIYSMDVSSAVIMDQLGGGQAFHHSTRVDSGAWTDTTTRRLFMGLIVDGIDVSAGGGGASACSFGFAQ
jgi:hypothetical protein